MLCGGHAGKAQKKLPLTHVENVFPVICEKYQRRKCVGGCLSDIFISKKHSRKRSL